MKRIIIAVTCLISGLSWSPLRADSLAPEAGESRDVNLSDAMDSAAKGGKSDLGGESSSESNYDDDDDDGDWDSWAAILLSIHGASYDEDEYFWQFPVDVRFSQPFSGNIRRLTHFTLTPVSFETEKVFCGLYVGGAAVDWEPDSLPDRGTKDPWMFEAGITMRYYLNGSHTALSPYLTGSIGFQALNWQYRNPIVAGGETIEYDGVDGVEGYAGLGISTKRNTNLSLFAEVGVGASGFVGITHEGFDNDVFDSFGFLSLKVGLDFKF